MIKHAQFSWNENCASQSSLRSVLGKRRASGGDQISLREICAQFFVPRKTGVPVFAALSTGVKGEPPAERPSGASTILLRKIVDPLLRSKSG